MEIHRLLLLAQIVPCSVLVKVLVMRALWKLFLSSYIGYVLQHTVLYSPNQVSMPFECTLLVVWL